ncbi:MAG: mercury methylation ferredoxin HgcB [Syntrophales bacterium]
MKGFTYLRNVATLKMRTELCTGCGRCREVCPHQVFSVVKNKALIKDINACMECGACAKNCPVDAIHVDSGVGCASGLIQEWLREQNFCKANRGCC